MVSTSFHAIRGVLPLPRFTASLNRQTSKWHTMINLERYGEARVALCRICEICRDSLAFLRIQRIKPTRRRIDAFVLNEGSQCLYEPCRFPRYNRLFIRVNDENSEFRLSCEDSSVTADYALISGIVQG